MGMPNNWHRRQALVLAGQLPENQEDALLIIDALEEIVASYLFRGEDAPKAAVAANVLQFYPSGMGPAGK